MRKYYDKNIKIKKEDAFTLVELLAVVLILGMLSSIAAVSYSKHLKTSRDKSFAIAEKTLITDFQNAYNNCLSNANNDFCSNHPNLGYQDEIISLQELIDAGYSDKIKNPYNTDELCDSNLSYVKITINDTNSINKDISYTSCLICGNKESDSCSN
jgi:general secretion pathway protein G